MSVQNSHNPLAQLNDIVGPSSPSFWPLPPVYWLLSSIVILSLLLSLFLLKKHRKQRLKQKNALQQLRLLQQSQADFVSLNQLLKGVALAYFPRRQVASLHGELWFDFLQRYAQAPLFDNKQKFIERLYQQHSQACSADDYIQARTWIAGLPKQIKKQTGKNKEKRNHV
ncbi:DUF4381 domain-containing protein [Psychromonas sp.]|uniref:DUF4381 domain-containing protein n=1 Tax=Psychromonas sp. TaxID=1884585 RepID=UPI003562D6EA